MVSCFCEAGSAAVWVVQNGTKFHVPNPEEFKALGDSWDAVQEVPVGSLNFLAQRPPDKTLFRERDSPAVYYFENGQKRTIMSETAFEKRGYQWKDIRVVPSGSFKSQTKGAPLNSAITAAIPCRSPAGPFFSSLLN